MREAAGCLEPGPDLSPISAKFPVMRIAVALFLLLSVTVPAAGQSRVSGVVRDESGAVVSGASVLVIGAVGRRKRQTVTGPDGSFSLDPGTGQWSDPGRARRRLRGTQPAAGAQWPAGHRARPGRAFRIGHRHADPHRAAARRRARQRQRHRQGADSPVAGHGAPTTSCAWSRRSACSAGRAACRRIPRRRACRCAASARAASAGRSC